MIKIVKKNINKNKYIYNKSKIKKIKKYIFFVKYFLLLKLKGYSLVKPIKEE